MDALRTLERLRALHLEQARIEHAGAAREADAQKRLLQQTESKVTEFQSFAREQMMRSNHLSVDALLRLHEFSALQRQELEAARSAWRTFQDQCDAALNQVVEQFKALSVIEKLRERRRIEASRAQARSDQKQLDEHGLIGDRRGY